MKIHFIGICGVSMSALAVYLHDMGHIVSGSDIVSNYATKMLKQKGINVYLKHNTANVIDKDLVVYNSAIKLDNVELKYALDNGIKTLTRSQLLFFISLSFKNRIGVCGCHGKTTTTALIANILKTANKKLFAHIGGFDKNLSNSFYNGNDFLVSEICEYKKNIDHFFPDIAVCLNVDNDHMECYFNNDDLIDTYKKFVDKGNIKIVCGDDEILKCFDNSITFGLNKNCDYYATNIKEDINNISATIYYKGKLLLNFTCKLIGKHNIYNILSAIAVCHELGISNCSIIKGLKRFNGVLRRNEFVGKLNNVNVVCDYSHHPNEIKSVLKSYFNRYVNPLVIFQPHTYSRTKHLFNDFVGVLKNVTNLMIYKTYPAREKFDIDGDGLTLSKSLPYSRYFCNFDEMIKNINNQNYDCILILGAGDIYDLIVDKINN